MATDTLPFSWSAPEFDESLAHSRFVLALLGIFLVIVAYALIQNSAVMAITFVLFGMVVYLHSREPIKTVGCAITAEGVVVAKDLYAFDNIESFWIIYEENDRSLFLKTRGSLISSVRAPLGSVDPNTVRSHLVQHAREAKYEPSIIDTLSRFLHI